MSACVYLEVEEVVAIQAQMIELFGGEPGIHGDQGFSLIDSAVNRPRYQGLYSEADLFAQAASLFWGLAKNHGFVDGNKRIAVAACDAFLQLNAWELDCPNEELVAFTRRCNDADWTEEVVEAWVREHVKPL